MPSRSKMAVLNLCNQKVNDLIISGELYRLIGAPSDPSVLNTGSFKKSKLTKKELKELNKNRA